MNVPYDELKTSAIERVLGRKDHDEVIYRNNLAITGKRRPRK
jgi:hypothetical protein